MKLPDVLQWMDANYPSAHNRSCGLHIHISLPILRYSQLMDQKFWTFFREKMGAWAKENILSTSEFWPRWNGENRYCQNLFQPDLQSLATGKTGERYCALNYAFNFQTRSRRSYSRSRRIKIRKTLEMRVFPVFKSAEIAQLAVCKYLSLVEEYLAAQPRSERARAVREISVDDEGPITKRRESEVTGEERFSKRISEVGVDGVDMTGGPNCQCADCAERRRAVHSHRDRDDGCINCGACPNMECERCSRCSACERVICGYSSGGNPDQTFCAACHGCSSSCRACSNCSRCDSGPRIPRSDL
jgi:hypothetical protein